MLFRSAGGTGSNSFSAYQPEQLPDALESGTLNVPAIAGLRRGIGFLNSAGIEKLHLREIDLLKKAYRGLRSIKNVILYTSEPTFCDAPVLSFNLREKDPFKAAEEYDKRGLCLRAGYHCAPDAHKKMGTDAAGTLRISLGASNNTAEIDAFLEITQKISK